MTTVRRVATTARSATAAWRRKDGGAGATREAAPSAALAGSALLALGAATVMTSLGACSSRLSPSRSWPRRPRVAQRRPVRTRPRGARKPGTSRAGS
eukprot:4983264-Prymnesium_polylepis.1